MYTLTKEHLLYLKKEKKKKRMILIVQIFILIILFCVWEILSKLKIINTFLYSSPSIIIKTIINLFKTNNLITHISITSYEVIISIIISFILSLIISTILWWNTFLNKVFNPYLTIINSLPKVSLGPLIIIWAGASMKSIIVMSLTISLFITIINLLNAFNSTNNNYIILMKSFKATKKDIFFKVILPSNKENIINFLKINMSMNFIGLLPPVRENILV